MSSEPKLTPRLEHAICDLVREGISLADAAHALGVHDSTIRRWVALGRRGDAPPAHARLVDGLQAAQQERADHVRRAISEAQSHREVGPRALSV